MQVRRPRRRLICTLTVLALFLGIAQTSDAGRRSRRRVINVFYKYVYLPGVDYYGNLSHYGGSLEKCKVIVNYRRGTCLAICRGKVKNQSRHTQRYYDIGLIPRYVCPECYWYKDKYTVYRNGRCRGIAWGNHYGQGYNEES